MCQKNDYTRRVVTVLLALATALLVFGTMTSSAQVSSSSPYTLKQSVVASGGGASRDAGGGFSIAGTIGRGNRNVRVAMTDAAGTTRTAVSGALGRFPFAGVAVGETYVFTAKGKRYEFNEPTVTLSIDEEATSLNFSAVSG